jgi:hypothetical protein
MKKERPAFILVSVGLLAIIFLLIFPLAVISIASVFYENPNSTVNLKEALLSLVPSLIVLAMLIGLWDMKRWVLPLVFLVSAYFWYEALSVFWEPAPGAEGLKFLAFISMIPFLAAFTVVPVCIIKNRNFFH